MRERTRESGGNIDKERKRERTREKRRERM
jgi:hypothetical protein